MPIFGDRSRFAVEFVLENEPQGEWLFGRFCYWVANVRVGDLDQTTSLRDVLFGLDEIAKYGAGVPRRSNSLDGLGASELFQRLDELFFGDPTPALRELAEKEQWAKHRILPAVDVFDDYKAYLVVTNDKGRIVHRRSNAAVVEAQIASGEFELVLSEAREALDALHRSTVDERRKQ